MKKAKEYANEIINSYIEKNEAAAIIEAVNVTKELFKEYDEICAVRKVTQYRGILSILKEQHIKWQSIARQVNKEIDILNERAFLNIIEDKMTMIYPNLLQIL